MVRVRPQGDEGHVDLEHPAVVDRRPLAAADPQVEAGGRLPAGSIAVDHAQAQALEWMLRLLAELDAVGVG